MKCVVTGATGFIGAALCSALLDAGHDVVPWSRSSASLILEGGQVLPTRAIELRETLLPELLADVDAVIHLAGIAHQNATEQDYDAVNFDATVRLGQAALAAGVGHFVFVSSVKAMGAPRDELPRSEEDCIVPDDPYGLSKWRAENTLRRELGGTALRLSIVRPALVYGPGVKGNLQLLAQGVSRGLPRPPMGGERSCIALGDLVTILCAAVSAPPRAPRVWIACAESYSTQQIYDLFCAASGKAPGRAWLPRWAWQLAAAGVDVVQRNPRQTTFKRLFAAERYSNARLLRESEWQAQYRLSDQSQALLQQSRS